MTSRANRVVRDQVDRERRRRRNQWLTVIGAVVLVVAALTGWAVWRAQQPDAVVAPAAATDNGGEDAGLVAAGNGPVPVEVYLDFICPSCKVFEAAVTPTLNQLVADRKITLIWHPLGFLDRASTTRYSTRSAAASGCAADAGKLKAYGEALFANQPAEGSAGLTDDQLIDLGGNLGLNAPSFAQCVRDGTYAGWVARSTDLAAQRGVTGTPTVLVDGKQVTPPTPDNIKAAVAAVP